MAEPITQADIDQSYRLMSLLRLCEAVAGDLHQSGTGGAVTMREVNLASSLELTLQAALEIAEGLHDKLEMAAPDDVLLGAAIGEECERMKI